MLPALAAVADGLVLPFPSADRFGTNRFIDGAATLVRLPGLPPLPVGMPVIGLGSSIPEIPTSALSASSGSPITAVGPQTAANLQDLPS